MVDFTPGMFSRHAKPRIEQALEHMRVVLIHGARQVGKTTLAREIAHGPDWSFVSLDESAAFAAANEDPQGFLSRFAGRVVIDEVQRAPGLYRAIKVRVDQDNRPGQYLLTGSANALLIPELADALAGRVGIEPLWPLSQGEITGQNEAFIDAVFQRTPFANPSRSQPPLNLDAILIRGGYPEAVRATGVQARRSWFESYIQTVLERDVKSLANVEALVQMPRLLRLIASRAGGLLNLADLSRSLAIPHTTLTRYLALLQATFLVHVVSPWMSNRGLRLSKSPKVYIGDTGLAAHLLAIDETRLGEDPASISPLLENFVAMELRKQLDRSNTRATLHHFRTAAGREVDFVLETPDGRIVGIEVKAGATTGSDDFKGLRALREAAGRKFVQGIVLSQDPTWIPFGSDMAMLPISALWNTPGPAIRES